MTEGRRGGRERESLILIPRMGRYGISPLAERIQMGRKSQEVPLLGKHLALAFQSTFNEINESPSVCINNLRSTSPFAYKHRREENDGHLSSPPEPTCHGTTTTTTPISSGFSSSPVSEERRGEKRRERLEILAHVDDNQIKKQFSFYVETIVLIRANLSLSS